MRTPERAPNHDREAARIIRRAARTAKRISYADADHSYTAKDGRRLPSVTQLLGAAGYDSWLRYVDADTLEVASRRGSFAHEITALIDERKLDSAKLLNDFPEYAGYALAWSRFRKLGSFEHFVVEPQVWNPALGYAGRTDRAGLWQRPRARFRTPAVLDIKTGQFPKSVWLQTMGYAQTYDFPYMERICVLLKPDGTFLVDVAPPKHWTEDAAQWRRIVESYNYNSTRGLTNR